MRSRFTRFAPFVVAAAALAPAVVVAQSSRAFVRVTARDSAAEPIPGAELTLLRGVRDVIGHATTDSAGHGTLFVDDLKDSTDLQVVMRKIGYPRGDRFFMVTPHDTAKVDIVVAHLAATTLAPVKVTASADLQRKSYHLDADDIANSNFWFTDAWDVVKRMRPDILTSRGGCATGVQEVWVNGKRIVLPLPPTGMTRLTARVGAPPRARFSYIPVSVLSEIAPEHIEEMTYHDCFSSMPAVGMVNALFVVLKPGVAFQQDVGSFVVDSDATKPTKSR